MATVTGYTDLAPLEDGTAEATAHYDDGSQKRCRIRLSVESQVRRVDGTVEPVKQADAFAVAGASL